MLLSSGFPTTQKKEKIATSADIKVTEKDEVDLYIENQEKKLESFGLMLIQISILQKVVHLEIFMVFHLL